LINQPGLYPFESHAFAHAPEHEGEEAHDSDCDAEKQGGDLEKRPRVGLDVAMICVGSGMGSHR
jgi:hypothetical protein